MLKRKVKTKTTTAIDFKGGKAQQDGRKVAYEVFDREGRLLEKQSFDKEGQVDRVEKYSYNQAGHLISASIKEDGKTTKFTYERDKDPQGRVVQERKVMLDGTVVEWKDYKHWEREFYDLTIRSHEKDAYPISERYDTSGRLLFRQQKDGIYEYDSCGNLSRIRFNGPEEHWYLVYENHYQPGCRLISQKAAGSMNLFFHNENDDVIEYRDMSIGPINKSIVNYKELYTYTYYGP